MRIAAFGDNCIDYYSNLERWYVTGNVVDFAFNMKKLGNETSVISVTGNDYYGTQVLCELNKAGIDVSRLRVDNGPTAVCHMQLINKERVHGKYDEGVMKNVIFSQDQIDYVAKHDYVHMAFYGHTEQYLPELKKKGCIVSFDYSDELDVPLVETTKRYVDYPFFSYKEHDSYIEEFLKDKVNHGAIVATATFGEQGSLSWDGQNFFCGSIVPTTVINTVGAGDSFIAGFMYGITQGCSIPECLKSGAKVSAEVVSVFGPWKENNNE